MVGRENRIFRAASLEEFQDGYQGALESPAGYCIRQDRKEVFRRLHVYESGYGTGWAMIHSAMFSMIGPVNRAWDGEDVRLSKYFPRYDLRTRVLHYESPKDWLYSAEALWMMCQQCWGWGLELTHFIDTAVADMINEAVSEAADDGVYQLRPTLPHQAN